MRSFKLKRNSLACWSCRQFGDVAASSGGPSPARAQGRYALGSRGCSPAALGLSAKEGARSEHPAATATLDQAWRSQESLPDSRNRFCCSPACRMAACHHTGLGTYRT
ncbi:hypothetical protein T06_667 [Trichinella sp. T6]|nr:hypothetical protein T06_667 [Trichinella sp. T6]